jgi:hypothetical protein
LFLLIRLLLPKQLALFLGMQKPRRSTAARALMVLLSRFLHWREALVIVEPQTFLNGIAPRSGRSGDGILDGEADRNCQRTCAN